MKIVFDSNSHSYKLNVDFSKLLNDWCKPLSIFLESDAMMRLMYFVNNIYNGLNDCFPLKKDLFKPFQLCKYSDLQVVILNANSSLTEKNNGLAFGNKDSFNNFNFDESLISLFNDIETKDYDGLMINKDYTLESWAKKGILLLNYAPTSYRKANHSFMWYNFTSFLLKTISNDKQGIIFVFIGDQINARYSDKINKHKHTLLTYNTFDYTVLEDINSHIEEINGKDYRIKW